LLNGWKFTIHPKHGSWLDIAEIRLSKQYLDRRISSLPDLNSELAAWEALHNASPAKIDWQFTTDDARIKLKRLYPNL
jgi:hypothetical protein